MVESLKNKTVKGVVWSSVERFAVAGLQFVIMIIMARVLTPEDYGLVAMLQIFIAVSQSLIDSGFSQALIRKLDRTQADYSTVFYFNIGVGFFLYMVLFVAAPLIADFYKVPELVDITRVMAIGMAINSFTVVQRAILTINIDFKTQAKATVIASIISGVIGISMAYSGCGVWSIIVQQLSNIGVNAIVLWFVSRWRPSKCFSMKSFRELFGFGSKLMLSGLLSTLWSNIYLIVIGKAFPKADLGYYTRAQQFADFPASALTGVFQRVTYPVLCHLQNDNERLAQSYRKLLRIVAFIIFPIMIGLAAISTPLVLLLLREQWLFTADLLKVICLFMMFYPVHAINLNLLQVKGRSELFLRLEVIKKIIGIVILVITLPMGLMTMCVGQIASSLISLVINTYYTGKLINVGFVRQILDLSPILLLTFIMGGGVYYIVTFFTNILFQLLAGIGFGILFYSVTAWLLRFSEMKELMAIIRRN
ncbi:MULTISPECIES: lipopolysaccharide biosynthesis protein [Butyricimonas]|jgi:lipopolysaccharide biosynthesis protein|uniref:O-antigen/teichoic acid export membrane protein n=3 Tax=Butyricimonas faecihominis TaxID=1472416 RepID=A0A7W6HY88_9BACT|nr:MULTISPECIES: lipopolysaccharide biosynthesis protein [Butyricimonas]MBS6687042.1 lipopolysaccharide biosynthesis protein [Sanguibacteroides justesenii]KAB1504705.1 lipopolysaccharide biosynthesis protein [Butyricimonas faecihominis]MBB4027226.1 O-antigen/teichoic acid export membrane protein [Butyricimonas faecihominis]WOF07425.1 lipopolysaccharide biosynthesis protein [Butyricimonas faecihominis]BEI56546.1 lipopolysaccharide biosynthesis protein [Butyricimonas faecihominis]